MYFRPTPVQLAAALLRMRGETLNQAAEATEIRASNLSVWLRGRQQVISDRRVALLLKHLGVIGRELRSDMLHRWTLEGSLEDLQTVLELVESDDRLSSVVFHVDDSDCLLWIPVSKGRAAILLSVVPGVNEMASPTAVALGFGAECELPFPLEKIAESTSEIASQLEREGLSEMDFVLTADCLTPALMGRSLSGLKRLQAAIGKRLSAGESYDEIAARIEISGEQGIAKE